MSRKASRLAQSNGALGSVTKGVIQEPKAGGRKRKAQSAVVENLEDRQASPDEAEAQNPELGDDDYQTTQARQPAVNSSIQPLPWKGRLGYAYGYLAKALFLTVVA